MKSFERRELFMIYKEERRVMKNLNDPYKNHKSGGNE